MDLREQNNLVDELIAQKTDRTVMDFIRVRRELEKYNPSMQRTTQNIKEKAPVATRAIN